MNRPTPQLEIECQSGSDAEAPAPCSRKAKPRVLTLVHRQRLDRAADHYLRFCYRNRLPARVSEFATFVGRTPEYLAWLARQAVGKSLTELLREKQLAEAVRLLRTTPLSNEEIAERAGFGTAKSLYRWFADAFSMSPGQFRQLRK